MNKKYIPSQAELEILQILWKLEPATVRQIHDELSQIKEVGYTTTLKQVQRLFDKQVLKRESLGKAHLYVTQYKEEDIKSDMFSKFKDSVFKGSAMDLVMHALGEDEPSKEDLDLLEKFLEEQKKNKK